MSEQANETRTETTVEFKEEAYPKLLAMIKETQPALVTGESEEPIRELKAFVDEAMAGAVKIKKNLKLTMQARIAAIDELLSTQLSEILHAPEFQKLEGSWRGLHYLVKNSLTGERLRIRVFNATKDELLKDFEKATRFDTSALWGKIYTAEYDQLGGTPYSALIGDYEFGSGSSDLALLTHISQVASGSHAPFISAASPQFFGKTSHEQLGDVKDPALHFTQPQYAKWRAFRATEESRYVGLTLPHVLMREPYGPDTKKVDAFDFKEDVNGKDHKKYLWGNAAYAMGVRMTEAFALYGWPVAIRGVEGGGAVLDLPTHTFESTEGEIAMKCPTEIAIPESVEGALSDEGFLPLCHVKNENYAAFLGGQSCQKALEYDNPAASANAKLSTRLPYILAVSRMAHYLKCIARDRIGGFMSLTECKTFLNNWITQYVSPEDDAPAWVKAQRPLREAQVQVTEVPGSPGRYSAVVHLRPHIQFEALSASLRLVAELPKSKA